MDDPQRPKTRKVSLPPRLQTPDPSGSGTAVQGEKPKVTAKMNLQKAFYDILIKDRERSIERLEERNDKLLNKYENMEKLLDTVDVETADEIAHLKRLLLVESEKVSEAREKVDNVEKLRDEEERIHLKNIDSANDKYENTRMALTLSVKALNAKINTLEDYKHSREALLEKLRIQDEKMAWNEQNMAQKQDAIDRKFKIDRDKLKNEMIGRLLALAGTFQLEIGNAISLPMHKLIRRNIFIRAELMQFVNEIFARKENCARMQTMQNVHRSSIFDHRKDERKNLITVKIQACLLRALKKMHSSMKERVACLDEPDEYIQETYDNLADSVNIEYIKSETRTRKLEVLLHQESLKLGRVRYLNNNTELRAKIYDQVLYDVKYAVACALKMTESTDHDILRMSNRQLISHLQHLFTRGQTQIHECLATASNESIPRPSDVYDKGDLGFEPEYIDLEALNIRPESSVGETTDKMIENYTMPDVLLQHPKLDEDQTLRSKSGTPSSEKTSKETTSTETKETSDSGEEDMFEVSSESIEQENEEVLSAESEEEPEEQPQA